MVALSPLRTPPPSTTELDDAVHVDDVWSWNAIRIEFDDPRSWNRDTGVWCLEGDRDASPAPVARGEVTPRA